MKKVMIAHLFSNPRYIHGWPVVDGMLDGLRNRQWLDDAVVELCLK